ncbi:hypothetical protein lerEdw1_011509 [Lerista edwardsae]|nr:hypothetical protein lerEdw1_011509 [Lerista edwardsae]
MGTGRRSWAVVGAVAALLWAAAAAGTGPPEQPAHAFSEVFFCQRDSPFSGLAQTLDDQPLFAFDFPGARWRPRLPDFQPEAHNRTARADVSRQDQLCGEALRALTALSDITPEARGIPHLEIFTLQPLQLGEPNTLVCSVTNLFPPSADITWECNGELVTEGVYTPLTYPVQGMDFQAFSYLEVTPQEGDVYSCTVKTPRDKSSSMAFWVPKDPIASDLPVNIACGVAGAVGVASLIVGVALIVRSCRASGGFVLHLETDCPLAADGRVLWANWTLAFNKVPFICYDNEDRAFAPCGLGFYQPWGPTIAKLCDALTRQYPDHGAVLREACREQTQSLWGRTARRRTPPNVRVYPVAPQNTPAPLMLACAAWSFYPADVNVTWLRNGRPLAGGAGEPALSSNGDWTYQATLTLPVAPQRGDVYSCRVEHAALPEPVVRDWAPGLPLELRVRVGLAVAVLGMGLVVLVAGIVFWKRRVPEGYIPIDGSTYPAGST